MIKEQMNVRTVDVNSSVQQQDLAGRVLLCIGYRNSDVC